jgi:hypothetical protein
MTGGRTSAVFGETLCLPAGRQGRTFASLEAISQLRKPRHPFVWRPAIQGSGEDHTGRVATRD